MSSTADTTAQPNTDEKGDALRQELLQNLQSALGESVLDSELAGNDLWVRIKPTAWKQVADVCKNQLGLDYFCFLSGIDWMDNPELSGENVYEPAGAPEEETQETTKSEEPFKSVAGAESRFQVLARLFSTTSHIGVTLKADLAENDPRIESWTSVYGGADWHERETWEMYGFEFEDHPGLRHLYLPGEFEGNPLRKDFALLAREVKPWPGLVDVEPLPVSEEVPGADDSLEASIGETNEDTEPS